MGPASFQRAAGPTMIENKAEMMVGRRLATRSCPTLRLVDARHRRGGGQSQARAGEGRPRGTAAARQAGRPGELVTTCRRRSTRPANSPPPARARFPHTFRPCRSTWRREDIILFRGCEAPCIARQYPRDHSAGHDWRKTRSPAAAPALDPLGLGTLVHAVLADLAAGSDDSPPAIEALVRRHAWLHLPESTSSWMSRSN